MSCESSITDLTMEMFEEDSGGSAPKDQLLMQIRELQDAVVEMKTAFTTAQLQLTSLGQCDDVNKSAEELRSTLMLKEELELSKRTNGELLQLILSLKGELGVVKETLQSTQIHQQCLQGSLQGVLIERDVLLDELAKTGAISDNIRGRLHSRLNGFARPSSGSQTTNDSGVGHLPHHHFTPLTLRQCHGHDDGIGLMMTNGSSSPPQGSSGGEGEGDGGDRGRGFLFGGGSGESFSDPQPLPLITAPPPHLLPHHVSPHVQEYLNNLQQSQSTTTIGQNRHNNQEGVIIDGHFSSFSTTEDVGNGVVYDSDCSLTLAATKSLSLSTSLSKQCGLELDHEDMKNRSRANNHTIKNKKDGQNYNSDAGGAVGSSSTAEDDLPYKEGQRLRVAKELLETERKYCGTLKTIQETFAVPLKASNVLSIKDINTLFPEEVFQLYEKHCRLLGELDERIPIWRNRPMIGDILERFTNGTGCWDVLRLYTSYVNDFPEVLKTFHKLCRSSREFTDFLRSSLSQPRCGGLDLGAFLLSPVQRMPRYILLLKQMIKYTDSTHPDYKDITTCLDRLRDYLKRLNDSMEHSFQLVTAQITPQPQHDNHHHVSSNKGFGSRDRTRGSVSSHSSSTTNTTNPDHHLQQKKQRYKRSTSVPRGQGQSQSQPQGPQHDKGEGGGKLKNRSKSDWTVVGGRCETCNCQSRDHHPDHDADLGGLLSDSDINSDVEEVELLASTRAREREGRKFSLGDSSCTHEQSVGGRRKFSTSKSLHDFHDRGQTDEREDEWFNTLCGEGEGTETETTMRKNVMIRPLTSVQPGRYVARIQRGAESDMNLHMIGAEKGRKKMSLRNSLKNIFSLKKRSTRTLQISGPILPSRPSITSLTAASCTGVDPVRALSYHHTHSRIGDHDKDHQSLPPESTSSCRSRNSHHGGSKDNISATGPTSLPPSGCGSGSTTIPSRYIRNPGTKLGNPKLPKTPFMTKYHQHHAQQQQRTSPFTDV